jgi:hypothetical protein
VILTLSTTMAPFIFSPSFRERTLLCCFCSSRSSFVLNLFLALHRMLPGQIYRAQMDKQNLDMLWICSEIRRILSGGIPLPLPFQFYHIFELNQ